MIYIQVDNEAAWVEIGNKSEWVNDMLRGNQPKLSEVVRKLVRDEVSKQLAEAQGF